MKPIDSGKAQKAAEAPAQAAPAVSCEEAQIDFSNVKIEPIFKDMVDFETFCKERFPCREDPGLRSGEEVQEAAEVHFG